MKHTERNSDIGFVLFHGAGLGSWIWDDVISRLEYPCLALDYPGRGTHGEHDITHVPLSQYVESAVADIDQFKAKTLILVAHSIGGVVALEVANRIQNRIAGFVAISAAIPPKNGTYMSCFPFLTGLFLRTMFSVMGTKPPESVIRSALCEDLNEEQASKVITRFVPESKHLYTERIHAQNMPENALYIHLNKDKALNDTIQKQMIKNLQAKNVERVDSGHLPMFNKAEELARILGAFVTS
jgi:pimeloyl-ACP methyl ester carboxylesterase